MFDNIAFKTKQEHDYAVGLLWMAVCNVTFCMGQPVLGLEHLLRTLHPDCASVDGTLVVGREIFHWPELSKVMVCGEHTPCQRRYVTV